MSDQQKKGGAAAAGQAAGKKEEEKKEETKELAAEDLVSLTKWYILEILSLINFCHIEWRGPAIEREARVACGASFRQR